MVQICKFVSFLQTTKLVEDSIRKVEQITMTIKINDPTFKDSTENKSRIYVQKKF